MSLKRTFYRIKFIYILIFFAILISGSIYYGNNPPVYEGGIELEDISNLQNNESKAQVGFIKNTNNLISFVKNEKIIFYDLNTGEKKSPEYHAINFHKSGRYINISTQKNKEIDKLLDVKDSKLYNNNDEFPIIILNQDDELKQILHYTEEKSYFNNFKYFVKTNWQSTSSGRTIPITIYETEGNKEIFTINMPHDRYYFRKYYQNDSIFYIVPSLNIGEKDLDNGLTSYLKIDTRNGEILKTVVDKYDSRGNRYIDLPTKTIFNTNITLSEDVVFSTGEKDWISSIPISHYNLDSTKMVLWGNPEIADVDEYNMHRADVKSYFVKLRILFFGFILLFIIVIILKIISRNYGKEAPSEEKVNLGLEIDEKDIASLQDESMLMAIVNNTKNTEQLRVLAIKKITQNFKFLKDVALNNSNALLRKEAVIQCKDQNYLKEIYEKTDSVRLKSATLERITDTAYVDAQYPTNDNALDKYILEQSQNQDLVFKIAKESSDKDNRLLAINKLNDDAKLIEILETEKDGALKFKALKNISETNVAVDIGLSIEHEDVNLWALKQCADQNRIIEIAEKNNNSRMRLKAIDKIENQEVIIKIATDTSKIREEREKAITLIRSDSELFKILQNPNFEDVHEFIRNRYPEVVYKEQQDLIEKYNESEDEKEKSNILNKVDNVELLINLYSKENIQGKILMLEILNDNTQVIAKLVKEDGEKGAKEMFDSGRTLNSYQIAEIKDAKLFNDIYSKATKPEEKEKIIEATNLKKNLSIIAEQEKDTNLQQKAKSKIDDMDENNKPKKQKSKNKLEELAIQYCAIHICKNIAQDLEKVPLDTATVGVVLLEQCATILDEIAYEDTKLVDDAIKLINQPNIINRAKSLAKTTFRSQVRFASEKPEVVEKFDLNDVLQTGINLIDQV